MSEEIENLKMGDENITDDDKLWAALSMAIGLIGLIILLAIEDKKNRPFIRHHAVVGLAASVGVFIVTFILGFIPIIQCLAPIVSLGAWVYLVYLAVTEAYNGKYVEIPGLNDFLKGQGWL